MNKSNYFSLNHQVAVYVPSTQGLEGKITTKEHDARRDAVASELSTMFGGATAQKAQGFYKANNGKLVIETVYIVEAFTSDKDLEAKSEELLQTAQAMCQRWAQESLLVEIDGNAYFIEQ